MEVLYFLEGLRNPVLDVVVQAVTLVGEETFFLALGLFLIWCCNKRDGYTVLMVSFTGMVINQFLKMIFRIPRPWIKDPNFEIVESAREGAGGYSFPSGHTQNSVGMLGALGTTSKKLWVKILCIVGVILVPLSRMYLGVHTPQDVLVSMAIAFVLIVGFDILLKLNEKHPYVIYIVIGCMLALTVSFLVYLYVFPFPEDVFSEQNVGNYNSALKNAYTMLGCILGILVFRLVDDKVTHYDTSAVWWAQLLKFLLGVGIVMLVKEGAKPVLNAVFGGHMAANAVRYFLVVVAATAWTFTFGFWKKLGQKSDAPAQDAQYALDAPTEGEQAVACIQEAHDADTAEGGQCLEEAQDYDSDPDEQNTEQESTQS